MAEQKDVTFEFNVFDDGRTHLKVLGPGTPTLEFLIAAKERLLDAVELWNKTHAAQQESLGAYIARRPDQIPDALEAEHRIVNEERYHIYAVRSVGGTGCDERRHRSHPSLS